MFGGEKFWENLHEICRRQYSKNPERYQVRRACLDEIQKEYKEALIAGVTPDVRETIRRKAFNDVDCFHSEIIVCSPNEEVVQLIKNLQEHYYSLIGSDFGCVIFSRLHRYVRDLVDYSLEEQQINNVVQPGKKDVEIRWDNCWQMFEGHYGLDQETQDKVREIRETWWRWVRVDDLVKQYGDKVPPGEKGFKKNWRRRVSELYRMKMEAASRNSIGDTSISRQIYRELFFIVLERQPDDIRWLNQLSAPLIERVATPLTVEEIYSYLKHMAHYGTASLIGESTQLSVFQQMKKDFNDYLSIKTGKAKEKEIIVVIPPVKNKKSLPKTEPFFLRFDRRKQFNIMLENNATMMRATNLLNGLHSLMDGVYNEGSYKVLGAVCDDLFFNSLDRRLTALDGLFNDQLRKNQSQSSKGFWGRRVFWSGSNSLLNNIQKEHVCVYGQVMAEQVDFIEKLSENFRKACLVYFTNSEGLDQANQIGGSFFKQLERVLGHIIKMEGMADYTQDDLSVVLADYRNRLEVVRQKIQQEIKGLEDNIPKPGVRGAITKEEAQERFDQKKQNAFDGWVRGELMPEEMFLLLCAKTGEIVDKSFFCANTKDQFYDLVRNVNRKLFEMCNTRNPGEGKEAVEYIRQVVNYCLVSRNEEALNRIRKGLSISFKRCSGENQEALRELINYVGEPLKLKEKGIRERLFDYKEKEEEAEACLQGLLENLDDEDDVNMIISLQRILLREGGVSYQKAREGGLLCNHPVHILDTIFQLHPLILEALDRVSLYRMNHEKEGEALRELKYREERSYFGEEEHPYPEEYSFGEMYKRSSVFHKKEGDDDLSSHNDGVFTCLTSNRRV